MTPSPQRPGGPGCLTAPLHHLGKQTSGRQPPDPTQGCWKWRGVGGSPVTEHALRLSRRDPAPCPSPLCAGPDYGQMLGSGGVRRGDGEHSAERLQCEEASPGRQAPPRAQSALLHRWVLG